MTLIKQFNKLDDTLIRTYKNKASGNITHTIRYKAGDKSIGLKVINCDQFGNPKILRDTAKNRNDVYVKAEDGSTILRSKGKIMEFPHIIFNSICEKFFRI